MQDKREQVQRLHEHSQQLMQQYFAQKREEQLEMRRLVEATTAGQQNVREARNKLTAMKQKIGKLYCLVQWNLSIVDSLGPRMF